MQKFLFDSLYSITNLLTEAGVTIVIDRAITLSSGLNHPASLFYMPSDTRLDQIVTEDKQNPMSVVHPAALLKGPGN